MTAELIQFSQRRARSRTRRGRAASTGPKDATAQAAVIAADLEPLMEKLVALAVHQPRALVGVRRLVEGLAAEFAAAAKWKGGA